MRWEKVYEFGVDYTDRMPVPGGWVYRTLYYGTNDVVIAMVFVPDRRVDEHGVSPAQHCARAGHTYPYGDGDRPCPSCGARATAPRSPR